MLMRTLATLVVLLTACSVCSPEDTYDIKVYPCARAQEAITIDGALDEPSWQRAPLVGGFTLYDKPELAEVQTFLRIIYDSKHLYFGVLCDEPKMKKLTPIGQARDASEVFHGETIEIFVDPKHDHSNYFQFAANAAGSMYDSRGSDSTWSADIAAKTKLGADSWTLEFAIPWEDLGVEPTSGMVVGFNVCRNRYLGTARQWTNWSQTKANFHDPERFAHLVLSPTAKQLGQMGEEFRKGDRRGSIVIYSKQGFSQTTYRSLAKQSIAKLEAMLTELEQTRDQEADAKTKAELDKRIKAYREETAPFHESIRAKEALDAAEWTRMDLRIHQLVKELGDVIWAARLAALLSDI